MEKVIEKAVKVLVEKSQEAVKSEDAMRFSQAAQNLANTLASIKYMNRDCEK